MTDVSVTPHGTDELPPADAPAPQSTPHSTARTASAVSDYTNRAAVRAAEMEPVDAREIDKAMIAGLYRRTGPLIVANFGALVLLTLALWGKADGLWLSLWAATLASWTLLRYGLARRFLSRPRALEDSRRWTLAFALGSTVAGCLWGSSVVFAGDLATDSSKLMTAFLMAALSAAAIAGYTNSLLAFAGFIFPALAPYAVRLVYLDGQASLTIAAFVVFWGLLLWIMARHLNHGFRESVALGLSNRNLAERWRRERDRAAAASAAKSRFLGHMSHELRTPLNAVIGYSELIGQQLLGPVGNEKYVDYAGEVERSGRHLLGLVDGMLDITELEAGGRKLDLGGERLQPLLLDAAERWERPAREAELAFDVTVPDTLPPAEVDADALTQVLSILLANAVKFTPAGGRVHLSAAANENGVTIEIADTGIGMTHGQAETVQIPFGQVEREDHLTRGVETGAGGHTSPRLNVARAKLLTEQMGGSFELVSEPGAGTRVSLMLKLAPVAAG
jgi:two-component system cell cycle sensor histidine kinase PleC